MSHDIQSTYPLYFSLFRLTKLYLHTINKDLIHRKKNWYIFLKLKIICSNSFSSNDYQMIRNSNIWLKKSNNLTHTKYIILETEKLLWKESDIYALNYTWGQHCMLTNTWITSIIEVVCGVFERIQVTFRLRQ